MDLLSRATHLAPLPLVAGGVGIAATVVVQRHSGAVCPMLAATGWYCPACGATRGVLALAHGEVRTALVDNVVLVVGLLVLAVRTAAVLTGREKVADRIDDAIGDASVALWAIALVSWTVVRNLPVFAGILRPVG